MVMYDKTLEPQQQDIKVTEIYQPALDYARVVCLFLPKQRREEFRQVSQDVFDLYGQRSPGDSRITKVDEKLETIQKIFESNL